MHIVRQDNSNTTSFPDYMKNAVIKIRGKIYWNFYHGIIHIVREGRRIRIILSDNMHVRGKIYWNFYHGIVHIVRKGRRIRIILSDNMLP
jgi:hypothetical protein